MFKASFWHYKGVLMMTKNEIRYDLKEKRRSISETEAFSKSLLAQRVFLGSEIYNDAKNLMVYMPLGNETGTFDIIKDATSKGKTVLVPVTDRNSFELTAHRITRDTEFEKGVFNLTEPKTKDAFNKSEIDVVLVPGVAFSKKGARIGFGKGCYDKFLDGICATKVGFCYDFQLSDEIEPEPYDIMMEFIVTEKELINCIG